MFEHHKPVSTVLGSVIDYEAMAVPEGHRLSSELLASLAQLPIDMALPREGDVTPWAKKLNDLEWESYERPPSYSLSLYKISDQKIRLAYDKLFGQAIPYLGIISRKMATQQELEESLEGTDYQLVDSFAVYQQLGNQKSIPDALYFHWIGLRPIGEKRVRNIQQAARMLRGQLVFAERVPYETAVARDFPAMTFSEAMNTILDEVSVEDAHQFENPTIPRTLGEVTPKQNDWTGPVLMFGMIAAVTYAVGRMASK